ncbi:MAG TPA: hypothetical protein VF934_12805 [Burkholderiales bacterium]
MGDTKIESPEVYLVTPSRPSRRHVFLHGIMSNMPKIPPDIAKKPVSDSRALIQAFPANNAAAPGEDRQQPHQRYRGRGRRDSHHIRQPRE